MSHPSDKITFENLRHAVYYHAPTPEKAVKYKGIADACYEFMGVVLENAPDCADRSAALRSIREARMWANSAIALDGPSEIASY